jgi:hypothetical protein
MAVHPVHLTPVGGAGCLPHQVLLLHCCHTVVTLLLHYCHTVVTLSLHCHHTVVTLLLHCCYTVVALFLNRCYTVVALLTVYHIRLVCCKSGHYRQTL